MTTEKVLLLLDVSKFIEFLYNPYQRYSVPVDKSGTLFGTMRNGYDYLAHVDAIISMSYLMDCMSVIKTKDNRYLEVFDTHDYDSGYMPDKISNVIPVLLTNLYLRMPWDRLGIEDRSIKTVLEIILSFHAEDDSSQSNKIFRMVKYYGDKTEIAIDTIESSQLVDFITFKNEIRKPFTSNMIWSSSNEISNGVYNLEYKYHEYIDELCQLRPITETDGHYLCDKDVVSVNISKLYENTLKNSDVVNELGMLDPILRAHIFSIIYTGMSRYMNRYNIHGRFSYEYDESISSTGIELPPYIKKYSLYLITDVSNIIPIFNYNYSLFINQNVNIGGGDVFDCYNIIMKNMVRGLCKEPYIKGITLKMNRDDEAEKIFDKNAYPLQRAFKAVKPSWFTHTLIMNRFYSWFNRCDLEGITQSVEVSFYVDISGCTYNDLYVDYPIVNIDYSMVNYVASVISKEFRQELDNDELEHKIELTPRNDKIRVLAIKFNKLKYARKFIEQIKKANANPTSLDTMVGRLYCGAVNPTITISIHEGLLKFMNFNLNKHYVFNSNSLGIRTPDTAREIAELYMLDQIVNPINTIDRLILQQ